VALRSWATGWGCTTA